MRLVIKTREYARFRAGLLFAADRNATGFQHWQRYWTNQLAYQFFKSGEPDAFAWFWSRFERDVGLMLADGAYTRVGAEQTL